MGVRQLSENQPAAKGCVSLADYKQGLRLRWKYKETRPQLYIPNSISNHLRVAQAIKSIIETDLITNTYDATLNRYKTLIKKASLQESSIETQLVYVASYIEAHKESKLAITNVVILKEFNNYLIAKGKSLQNLSYYYHDVIRLMKRWGEFTLDQMVLLLAQEKVSNKTFNDRRNCLFKFLEWCVRKEKILYNPFADVPTKRRNKAIDQRKPFTDSEALQIIEALKNDTHSKNKLYPHSQYWRFVAFLLHVGCRTGEAIGLRIKEVNFERKEIRIAYSFSRTMKGTSVRNRILKGTKTDNVRFLPMDDYLYDLLYPICNGRKLNEFVFVILILQLIDSTVFLQSS